MSLGAESLAGLYREIELLGRLTGREIEAGRLSGQMKRRVDKVSATARAIRPQERVTVFYHVWSEPLTAAGPNSYLGELIALCGATNIVEDVHQRYPHISQEVLLARDPEVILAPSAEAEPMTIERLRTRPGWSHLKAIRNRRVYLIDGDLVSRCGPRLVDALRSWQGRSTPIASRPIRNERLTPVPSERSQGREGPYPCAPIAHGDPGCGRSVSLGTGPVSIPAGRVAQILTSSSVADRSATDVAIIWDLPLPRVLLASLIGGGLGAAGAGYQGLFRNPLADPFVIRRLSGAALGSHAGDHCGAA